MLFLYLPPRKTTFQTEKFSTFIWKNQSLGTSTWSTQKRNFYVKKCEYFSKNSIFQTKRISTSILKNQLSTRGKTSLYLPEKLTNFLSTERISYNCCKNQFSKQNILCTCAKECFSSDVFWIQLLFSLLEKLKFFLYSTSFCFSSSEWFLNCLHP